MPHLLPHERHNIITNIIVEKLNTAFPSEIDRMIALETIMLGVISGMTKDAKTFATYLKICSEGAEERFITNSSRRNG